MAKTFKTTLLITGKVDKSLKNAMKAAESSAAKTGGKISGSLKKAAKVAGGVLVAGITAAAVSVGALGAAAVHNAAEMQSQMKNVATLLDGTAAEVAARTSELSEDIIKVSNTTGIATTDLTSGMYDVISAVGDSEDAVKILETSAKAAAAGNAETSEAVSLLTAVTKGYGDTSAEAFNKASDLAFQTVKLGQTTFPELAASIGKVTPIASALGVQQEELFGVFSTLTGVTGTAAEVATQYKGVLAGLMTPSQAMQDALDSLGYSTGSAAIEALGFQGTLDALMGTTEGDVQATAKLFSSVEAQTAVLSLCGAQAENLTEKTDAMYNATKATNNAFATQTDTLEYTIQSIKNLGQNFLTSVGTKILPYVQDAAEKLLPKVEAGIDALLPVLDNVAQKLAPVADYVITQIIPGFVEFAGKIMEDLKPAFEAAEPILSNIMELAADFAQNGLPQIIDGAEKVFEGFINIVSTVSQWDAVRVAIGLVAGAYAAWKVGTTVKHVYDLIKSFAILNVAKLKDKAETLILNALYVKDAIVKGASTAATTAMTVATTIWNGVSAAAAVVTTALGAAFTFLTSPIGLVVIAIAAVIAVGIILYRNWDSICVMAQNLWNKFMGFCGWIQTGAIAAWNAFIGIIQNTTAFQNLMIVVDTIKTVFSNLISFVQNVFAGNWQAAWQNIVNIFKSIFEGIKGIVSNVLNACCTPINAIIRGVNKVRGALGDSPIPEMSFPGFANGGTVTSPTLAWVGEGRDTETIIPHNNTPRSRALLETAAKGVYGSRAAAASSGGKTVQVTYAPVIYGGGNSVKEDLKEDFERFKEFFGRHEDEDDREVFV